MSPLEPDQNRWFAEHVLPHEAALKAYLRGRFPAAAGHVDDLVQEAYARILRARAEGTVGQPRAYLFATARNAALDLVRRDRLLGAESLETNEEKSVIEEKPDAAEAASHDQEVAILNEAIEALPERCREVLRLRRFQGLSYREIAERMEISENTVNAQLAIAMLRCREFLDRRGVLRKGSHAGHHAR